MTASLVAPTSGRHLQHLSTFRRSRPLSDRILLLRIGVLWCKQLVLPHGEKFISFFRFWVSTEEYFLPTCCSLSRRVFKRPSFLDTCDRGSPCPF